jgi:hypothetical protein
MIPGLGYSIIFIFVGLIMAISGVRIEPWGYGIDMRLIIFGVVILVVGIILAVLKW